MIDLRKEKCKLCGASLKTIAEGLYDNRYGLTGKYSIGYCNACELGETFPKPSFYDIPSKYEETIGNSSAYWFKKICRKCKRSVIGTRLILQLDRANVFLDLLPPSSKFPRLLDIGCGVGDWLVLFKNMGFDVQGIDLNPRVVQVAAERGFYVECRRIEELATDRKTFNIVVLSQVLEHLLEPKEVLQKIQKLLQPSGKLLISVPNFDSKWRRYFKKHWINWYMPFHIFHFTKRALLKNLEDSSFRAEKVFFYTPPTWWINSAMVKLFNQYGKPNTKVNKWWHYLLVPFISIGLILFERLWRKQEGDCLCVLAKKIEER
jgi:2-polyprenyl-3-methyl-5-hydroxy-6-metoxy-1,4-benzoquinol methylase